MAHCHLDRRMPPLAETLRNLVLAALPVFAVATAAAAPHPLDGLSVAEHRQVIELLRGQGRLGDDTVVASMHLLEPDKAEVLAWTPGRPIARRALVVLRDAGRVHEARVDLRSGAAELREVAGVQSQFTDRDYRIATDTKRMINAVVAAKLLHMQYHQPGLAAKTMIVLQNCTNTIG